MYPLELQQLTNESILSCNNVDETPPVGHLPVETVRRSARLMAQRAKSHQHVIIIMCNVFLS